MESKTDLGTLSVRLKKDECLLIETSEGPIQIFIKDGEKKPIVSRVIVKAPKQIKIDTILNTQFQDYKI